MHTSLDAAIGERPLGLIKIPFTEEFGDPLYAYSLRDLTGNDPDVVRVQRDSDSTIQIFKASQLKNGEMDTFAQGDRVRVVTWYDQTGNNDLQMLNDNISNAPYITDSSGNYLGAISWQGTGHNMKQVGSTSQLIPWAYYISIQSRISPSTSNRFTFTSPSFFFFDNIKFENDITRYQISHLGAASSTTDLGRSDTFGEAVNVITGLRQTDPVHQNIVYRNGSEDGTGSSSISRNFNGFQLGGVFGAYTDYFIDEIVFYSGENQKIDVVKSMRLNN